MANEPRNGPGNSLWNTVTLRARLFPRVESTFQDRHESLRFTADSHIFSPTLKTGFSLLLQSWYLL